MRVACAQCDTWDYSRGRPARVSDIIRVSDARRTAKGPPVTRPGARRSLEPVLESP